MQRSIFGESVFGGAIGAADPSASHAILPGQTYGTNVAIPIDASQSRLIGVTNVAHRNLRVPSRNIPPGSVYGVDATKQITATQTRFIPVTAVGHQNIPIASSRMIEGENISQFSPTFPSGRPGVFHRPPYVGGYRYERPHAFGPPILAGYGSPDGLGGLVGIE